jgi:hypothetical protein
MFCEVNICFVNSLKVYFVSDREGYYRRQQTDEGIFRHDALPALQNRSTCPHKPLFK